MAQLGFSQESSGFTPPIALTFGATGGTPLIITPENLQFWDSPYSPPVGTVDLVFGAQENQGTEPPVNAGTMVAEVRGPTAAFVGNVSLPGTMVAYVNGPTAAFDGEYDINVDRDPKGQRTSSWQVAGYASPGHVSTPWTIGAKRRPDRGHPWQESAPLATTRTGSSAEADDLRKQQSSSWEVAAKLRKAPNIFVSEQAARLRVSRDDMRYEEAARLQRRSNSMVYEYAAPLYKFIDGRLELLWRSIGPGIEGLGVQQGLTCNQDLLSSPFEQAGYPGPGQWGGPVPPDPDPEPEPVTGDLDMVFCLESSGFLVPVNVIFGRDPCEPLPEPDIAIPVLRVYVVSNSASIVRVSDGTQIPATAVSLSSDIGNIAWEMSASIVGKDAAALVEGTDAEPVEVDVTINGYTWRLLVDRWSLQEAAVSTTGTISGRSRSAYLGAPYTLPRSFTYTGADRLIAQLAEDELNLTGWNANWTAVNYLIPANAWSYQNLTPLQSLARLAEGAAAFVRTDRVSDTLHINPRYPHAPWTWEAQVAAVNLPRDVLFQRSSQKTPGTATNGVWVHGGNNGGVLRHVRRNGTAGSVLAPTVVDDLITHNDVARERGIAALATTTRQSIETFDMPLAASMGGLRTVGELVAIGEGDAPFTKDYTALIKAVKIDAQAGRGRNGGATLQVRQSLSLERFFAEVV